MLFELTDDQAMIEDMVTRLVTNHHSLAVRRAVLNSAEGWSRDLWKQLADLGILGAALPLSVGGLGGGAVETMLILKALSGGLVVSPFISTIICSASLIARCGSDAQRDRYLPAILSGDSVIAFAGWEACSHADPLRIATTATPRGEEVELTGDKPLVMGGAWADHLLVVAAMAGDGGAPAAFVVPVDAPGICMRHCRTIGGERASEIRFDRVVAAAGARIGGADLAEALQLMFDEALIALCAEACGATGAIVAATVEYARTREQFGRPIGSNQSIGHRIVDMSIRDEQLNAVTLRAALSAGCDPDRRRLAASAAKAGVGRLGRSIAQAAVQIHGGIGVTDELELTHHVRRLELIDALFGSSEDHVDRYADLITA